MRVGLLRSGEAGAWIGATLATGLDGGGKSRQPALADASEYIRASSARQLLERLRPDLAFAGITTNLRTTAEDAPPALEQVVEAIAATLEIGR